MIRPQDAKAVSEIKSSPKLRVVSLRGLDILRTLDHTRPEYAAAVASWPDPWPIWPALRMGLPQLKFIRFCLAFGRSEGHVTQHFASQPEMAARVYARLSARSTLTDISRRNLYAGTCEDCFVVPPKLRLPLLLASSQGTFLNAIHLGGRASSIFSYVFVDPREDEIIVPRSDCWYSHVMRDWIVLGDLIDCDPRQGLRTRYVQGFVSSDSGTIRAMRR